jgi:hypothetical protein
MRNGLFFVLKKEAGEPYLVGFFFAGHVCPDANDCYG